VQKQWDLVRISVLKLGSIKSLIFESAKVKSIKNQIEQYVHRIYISITISTTKTAAQVAVTPRTTPKTTTMTTRRMTTSVYSKFV
jgi:hypothetical protein